MHAYRQACKRFGIDKGGKHLQISMAGDAHEREADFQTPEFDSASCIDVAGLNEPQVTLLANANKVGRSHKCCLIKQAARVQIVSLMLFHEP